MDKCGYSTTKSDSIGLVAHTYCDYFGSAGYPGMVDVGLRVVKLGKSSVMYECGIFQRGDEKVKAVGGMIQIWVKRSDNRPAADGIEPHIREVLEKLVNSDDAEIFKPKL